MQFLKILLSISSFLFFLIKTCGFKVLYNTASIFLLISSKHKFPKLPAWV